ncbi:MAG TPA: GNAT family N-acetyltransferase [Gaiellaceae bacterium]|nr:GNAT family N-acetyltransferase [Gaiellaceae bacterium]
MIREDGWLSERIGHPVFTVDDPSAVPDGDSPRMYQARVPVEQVAVVRAFTSRGFSVIDTTLTLERAPVSAEAEDDVVRASPEQRDAVVEIARTSFRWSRFHLDPEVPDEAANRIKADWIGSYFDGTRGDELLVALDAHGPAGFLAVLVAADGAHVIDLVAVAERARGRGFARALTAASGATRVGTQAANVAATGLYESMGFSLARAEYALHLHI